MTPDERVSVAHSFSTLAERHFRAGENMAGAEMLYGALTQVVIAIAMQRNQPYQDHQHRRHTVRSLTIELHDPDLADAFRKAQRLHVHFYLNNLDDADFETAVAVTRGLINRLLPLAA